MSLLPVAPSPPNPFPSTQHSNRDTTLSPLSPSPPRPLRSPRRQQRPQQQRRSTTTPLRCVGQTWRSRNPSQCIQTGPKQRRSASDAGDAGVHECYRPSMAGWWVCCQCDGVNNPGLTPEKCPTCAHSLCKAFCEVLP